MSKAKILKGSMKDVAEFGFEEGYGDGYGEYGPKFGSGYEDGYGIGYGGYGCGVGYWYGAGDGGDPESAGYTERDKDSSGKS